MGQLIKWFQKRIDQHRRAKYSENHYYRILLHEDQQFFELLHGPFKGILYTFDVHYAEGSNNFAFSIEVYETDAGVLYKARDQRKYTDNLKFTKIVDFIFHYMVNDAVENHNTLKEEILNDDSEDRASYFEEPFAQRTVCKKNPARDRKRVRSKQVGKNSAGRIKDVHPEVQPPAVSGSNTTSTPE